MQEDCTGRQNLYYSRGPRCDIGESAEAHRQLGERRPRRGASSARYQGELPAHKVYEDTDYVAFLDINPFSKGHTLVCPRRHGETIWDMKESEIGGLFMAASKVSGQSSRPRARTASGSSRTTGRPRTRSSRTSTSTSSPS